MKQLLTKRLWLILIPFAMLTLAACGTLEVGVEPTSTPEPPPPSETVPPTEPATISPTVTEEPPRETPTPSPGAVSGIVCYPSEVVPEMTAFFEQVETGGLISLPIERNQTTYKTELPPGTYIAYAWLPDFTLGGLYSRAVPCGLSVECTDHSPIQFEVRPGETTTGVDLCDWYGGPDSVPLPPGESGTPGDSDPLAGLSYLQGGNLWQIDRNGQPVQILGRRVDAVSPDGQQAIYVEEDDLWLVALPDGEPRRLTDTPDRVEGCAVFWPARPEVIVFTYQPVDQLGPSCGFLAAVGVDGTGYRDLDPANGSSNDPAPSPDGQTIAYADGQTARLYRWSGDIDELEPTGYGLPVSRIGSPSWSPDGRRIAFIVNQEGELGVGIYDLDTTTARLLHPYAPLGGRGGWPPAPAWSPDGEWLAFVTWGESQDLIRVGLWVTRADGSEEHLMGVGNVPLWSPDGGRMAFQRISSDNITSIWVAERGIWELQQALTLPASGDTPFAWIQP
jgi:Tol biopolymer transport system component